jgi:hypothetical protein
MAGTERKDGLRCVECVIFRNETRFRSSKLISDALACLMTWKHYVDVDLLDGIITGVNSVKSAKRRSEDHAAGHCFREAGFEDFTHPGRHANADVWLRYTGAGVAPRSPEQW